MTSDHVLPPPTGFAARLDQVHPIILALVVTGVAALLPMAHIAVHGSELLTANLVTAYADRGSSPALAATVRTVAESRLRIQPILGPFHSVLLMLGMAGCGWLFARWRTVRIPLGTTLRAAAVAVAAGQVFFLLLYFAGWGLFGSSAMVPEWQRVVPTSLAALQIGVPVPRKILEGVTMGAIVRFAALGVALRLLVPAMPRRSEWVVVACTSALMLAVFVLGSLL